MKHKFRHFLRQLALTLLVIWTVVSLVTLMMGLVQGGPAAAILGETATAEQIEAFNVKHGLDKPLFFFSYSGETGFVWNGADNQYVNYFKGLLHAVEFASAIHRSLTENGIEIRPRSIEI